VCQHCVLLSACVKCQEDSEARHLADINRSTIDIEC